VPGFGVRVAQIFESLFVAVSQPRVQGFGFYRELYEIDVWGEMPPLCHTVSVNPDNLQSSFVGRQTYLNLHFEPPRPGFRF
jgi:hypothetical protein